MASLLHWSGDAVGWKESTMKRCVFGGAAGMKQGNRREGSRLHETMDISTSIL